MRKKWIVWLLAWTFVFLSVMTLQLLIQDRVQASGLSVNSSETAEFRQQKLSVKLYRELREQSEKTGDFGNLLTSTMLNGRFAPVEISENV